MQGEPVFVSAADLAALKVAHFPASQVPRVFALPRSALALVSTRSFDLRSPALAPAVRSSGSRNE